MVECHTFLCLVRRRTTQDFLCVMINWDPCTRALCANYFSDLCINTKTKIKSFVVWLIATLKTATICSPKYISHDKMKIATKQSKYFPKLSPITLARLVPSGPRPWSPDWFPMSLTVDPQPSGDTLTAPGGVKGPRVLHYFLMTSDCPDLTLYPQDIARPIHF